MSTGRVCDGYGIWGGGGNAYGSFERAKAAKSSQQNTGIVRRSDRAMNSSVAHLPPSICQFPSLKGAKESLAFDYFWQRTTIKLVGIFESTFWKSLVLQACSQEPAVLHAVVATGAAHRSQEVLSLQQYNKAIIQLSRGRDRRDNQATRLTLMACLVFICLELLRGNFQAGYLHMQQGLSLLGAHLNDHPLGDGGDMGSASQELRLPRDSIDAHLVEAFLPLNLQAHLFGLGNAFSMQLSYWLTSDIPHKFESLREARLQLLNLVNAVQSLSTQAALELSNGSPFSARLELLKQDTQFALILWRQAFDNTPKSLFAGPLPSMAEGSLIAYHLLTTLQADTSLRGSDEMVFDDHHGVFGAILQSSQDVWDLARAYMAQTIARGENHSSFTIDLGFIPPLYFTAIKCREPTLRRRAIDMLVGSSHREGIWDGYLVARIARHVVRLEEGGFINTPTKVIENRKTQTRLPLSARFNAVSVEPLTEGPGSRVKLFLQRLVAVGDTHIVETTSEVIDVANDGRPPPEYPIPTQRPL